MIGDGFGGEMMVVVCSIGGLLIVELVVVTILEPFELETFELVVSTVDCSCVDP